MKITSYLDNGQTRVQRKFLLTPTKLFNKTTMEFECRWLEFADVEQLCQQANHCLWYEWQDRFYVGR